MERRLSRPFYSKYAGTPCSTCGSKIQVGHLIQINSMTPGVRLVYHQDCERPAGTRHRKSSVNLRGGTKPNTYKRKIKRK